MGRAGDRVFVDAEAGGKEAGDEIVAVVPRRGDHHTAHGQMAQGRMIRLHFSHNLGRFYLHQIVEAALAHKTGGHAQGLLQPVGARRLGRRPGRKVEFDPLAHFAGGEQAAAGVETGFGFRGQTARLPEGVGAGKSGVATQVHLHRRGEPTQAVAVGLGDQKGGFGEIHFQGHRLHPRGISRFIQHTDSRGVAAEGLVGEGVYLEERDWH